MRLLRQARGGRVAGALRVPAAGLLCVSAVAAADLPRTVPRMDLAFGGLRPAGSSVPGATFRPQPLGIESRLPVSFYDRHLLPRLNQQFDKLAAYQGVPGSGDALSEYVLFDDLTDRAGDRALKGAGRAFRYYLLEQTSLDRVLYGIRGKAESVPGERSRFGYGLSTAHGTGRVDLRYRIDGGVLRFGLGIDGSLRVELRHEHARATTRFGADYDRDEHSYRFGCRVAF